MRRCDPVLDAVLVAILAGPLLGEWIGWRRWVGDPASASPACCW